MPRIAAVITTKDLSEFFKGDRSGDHGPDRWTTRVNKHGEFEASCKDWVVDAAPGDPEFHVKISAHDDDTDSDEGDTDDPVGFIADFMGSGGDFFRKMSSGPEAAVRALRALSIRVRTGSVSEESASRKLRRAAAAFGCARRTAGPRDVQIPSRGRENLEGLHRTLDPSKPRENIPTHEAEKDYVPGETSNRQGEAQLEVVDRLASEMESKGWRVAKETADTGLPLMRVDVGGEYEAVVTVKGLPWKFHFDLRGTDVSHEGTGDDPIEEWRRFSRGDDVKRAKADRAARPSERAQTAPAKRAEPEQGTVKPGKQP